MPYAMNGGVRIHYEVEGTGPALVLHHWTFSSLDDWYELRYVDALASHHRLLLIDSRAHGKSDAPHEESAYRPEPRVGDVVAVLDAAGVRQAAFFGYSMGGWIGFACAKHSPERWSAFILGGQHPYAQVMDGARAWLAVGEKKGAQAFIGFWEREVGPLTPTQRERVRTYDFTAMRMAAQDRASLELALSEIHVPCLLFAGSRDGVFPLAQRAAEAIPGGQFVALADLGHADVMTRSDLVVPMVRSFLQHAGA